MKVAGMGHGAIADLCVETDNGTLSLSYQRKEAADLLLDLMEKKRRQQESRMLKYEVIRQKQYRCCLNNKQIEIRKIISTH